MGPSCLLWMGGLVCRKIDLGKKWGIGLCSWFPLLLPRVALNLPWMSSSLTRIYSQYIRAMSLSWYFSSLNLSGAANTPREFPSLSHSSLPMYALSNKKSCSWAITFLIHFASVHFNLYCVFYICLFDGFFFSWLWNSTGFG